MISKNKTKNINYFQILWVTGLFLFNISCTKEDLVFKNFNSRAASKDSTVPQLTSVDYINFSNQANYTLLGTCPEGVEKLMLEVNTDAVNALTLNCSSGQFTTSFDFSAFLDGVVYIKMIPYSAATAEPQAEKSISATLQKDTLSPSAPSIGSLSLQGLIGNYFNSSTVSPVFSWGAIVDLESGLDRYEVKIVSGLTSVDVTAWSAMISGSALSGLELSNGQQYYYQLRAWDKAGNVSTVVQSNPWTVDTALPVIASFNDGTDSFYEDRSPRFSIQSNDGSGSGVVSYKVDVGTSVGSSDILSGFVVTTWVTESGFHKFSVESLTLSPGLRYFATVRAIDFAGNISAPIPGDGWLVNKELFVTDKMVNAIVKKNDKLYIGGSFNNVGPWTGGGLNLALSDGAAIWPNPNAKARVSGFINSAISDGSGGVFIAGLFSHVGGLPRSNLARILNDGTVDPHFVWDIDKEVKTLALSGSNILFVGGLFTKIGMNNRNYLASIDVGLNSITAWTPNPNAFVNVITVNGSTVYVGGSFTSISGETRNRIAAYDATVMIPTINNSWNPSSSAQVNAIAVSGTTVYVGGIFVTIGGQTRNRIAALDIATGFANSWNPSSSGQVNAIAVSGSTVYVGGLFTNIGGQARNNFAALNSTTGLASAWNPNLNNEVKTLAVDGGNIYAGGYFTTLEGGITTRKYIASWSLGTEILNTWNPNLGGVSSYGVKAILPMGASIFVGGDFSSQNMTSKNYLAAIDLSTGGLDGAFNSGISGGSSVSHMVATDSKLIVGGSFTFPAVKLAVLDITTGANLAGAPFGLDSFASIKALTLSEDGAKVYIGVTSSTGSPRIGLSTAGLIAGQLYLGAISTADYSWSFSPISYGTFASNTMSIAESSGNLFVAVSTGTSNINIYSYNSSGFINSSFGGTGSISYNSGSTIILGNIFIPKSSANLYLSGQFDTDIFGIKVINQITGSTDSFINPGFDLGSYLGNAQIIDSKIIWTGTLKYTIGSQKIVNALITDLSGANIFPIASASSQTTTINTVLLTDSTIYLGGSWLGLGGGSSYLTPIDLTTGLWLPGH